MILHTAFTTVPKVAFDLFCWAESDIRPDVVIVKAAEWIRFPRFFRDLNWNSIYSFKQDIPGSKPGLNIFLPLGNLQLIRFLNMYTTKQNISTWNIKFEYYWLACQINSRFLCVCVLNLRCFRFNCPKWTNACYKCTFSDLDTITDWSALTTACKIKEIMKKI